MTFQGDPYRTLGVAPGASLNEIKSAYRRLAKRYHPDAAGERALPRFLAIQAAYERLVDGEGRLRPPGWGTASGTGPTAPGGGDPWRADPGRARASRDAWRARRSGSGGTAGHGARASGPGGTGASGPGRTQAGGERHDGGERHHGARRGPKRATPGSTTYDEAAETPFDPEWDGGAWYGPSSGTYWTINPREYADPRKHGPDYLARARRAAAGATGAGSDAEPAAPVTPGPDGTPHTEGTAEAGDWEWTGAGATTTDGGAAAWGARGWTFDAREHDGPGWTPGREGRAGHAPGKGHGSRAASEPPAEVARSLPDLESLARRAFPEALLALALRPDRRWRLLLALVGWPPIGYALGTLASVVTGCASYSASCPDAVPVLVVVAQPLVVAVLFAVAVLAAVAAFGSIAALAIAVPAGAVLSVGALPRPAVEPAVLGIIVGTTYLIAIGAAVARLWGRPNPPGA